MNRSELVPHVAAGTSLSKSDAASAVGIVFHTIAGGELVTIAGFGTFATRDRLVREGRKPAHRRDDRPCAFAHALVQRWQVAARMRQPNVLESARPKTGRLAPPSQTMSVAERKRTESDSFTKCANMCADLARTLDACGVATPYRRKRKLAPTAAVLALAQATYRSGFRGAYTPHRLGAMPPCRPSTAK